VTLWWIFKSSLEKMGLKWISPSCCENALLSKLKSFFKILQCLHFIFGFLVILVYVGVWTLHMPLSSLCKLEIFLSSLSVKFVNSLKTILDYVVMDTPSMRILPLITSILLLISKNLLYPWHDLLTWRGGRGWGGKMNMSSFWIWKNQLSCL
jgi:hypothetical protein